MPSMTDNAFISEARSAFASVGVAAEATPVCHTVAPGRLNLIGEHVDYVGGRVLPAALPLACEVGVFKRTDAAASHQLIAVAPAAHGSFDKCTVDISGEESVAAAVAALPRSKSWSVFVTAAVAELCLLAPFLGVDAATALSHLRGVNVFVVGHVPLGAGLSSSASLCVGLLHSFASLATHKTDPVGLTSEAKIELAKAARRIENNYCGVQCGIMDQFASVHGEEGCFLEVNCDTLWHRTHSLSNVLGSEYQFVLVNSMISHSLGEQYNIIRRSIESAQRKVGASLNDPSFLFCTAVSASIANGDTCAVPNAINECRSKGHLDDDEYRCSMYVAEEMLRTQQFLDLVHSGAQATAADASNRIVIGIGALLNATHKGLAQQLQVSTDELNFIQSFCTASTDPSAPPLAIGGRLMGGGFGGCCLLLVERAKLATLRSSLSAAFFEAFGVECAVYPVETLSRGVTTLFLNSFS